MIGNDIISEMLIEISFTVSSLAMQNRVLTALHSAL